MQEEMKKEERASLSVTKDTRDRVMDYLTLLIGERRQLLTQDDVIKELLDCAERERSRKK
jgi:hypothetical protein